MQRLLDVDGEDHRLGVLWNGLGACDAEAVLTLLKAESERYCAIDPHVALRLAEALLQAAAMTSRLDHKAMGLMAKGDALRYLGQYRASVSLFEEAGAVFLSLRNEVGWARTRIGWLVSLHRLGRGTEGLRVVDRAREILVYHQEWFRAAGMDLNAAAVCRQLGRYAQALGLCERAQKAYEALGDSTAVQTAWVKTNKAINLTLLGDFRTALGLHAEARQVYARHGRAVSVIRNDQNVAYVYAGQGHYTRALRLLADALMAAEHANLTANAIAIAIDTVECYLALNRNAEAAELAQETIARAEQSGTPTEAARARFFAALAAARLGNAVHALLLLGQAARTFAAAALNTELGVATLLRAKLHVDNADWSSALDVAARAHALFAEHGVAVRQAETEMLQARALLGAGEADEASRRATSALAIMRAHDAHWLDHESHHTLARAAQARGELGEAQREYRTAIDCIERVQTGLANALRTNFLDDKLSVYWDAIDHCLQLNEPAQAFEYLERAKSRALVDYLATNAEVRLRAHDTSNQDLVDELSGLRDEHRWFYDRLYRYGVAQRLDAGAAGDDGAEAAILQAAIREREKRITRLLERLALRRAEDLEGVASPPPNHRLSPPALDAGTVLLEYYFREHSAAVFVVSDGSLRVVPLAAGPGEIQRLLRLWQLNIDATARAHATAAPLDALDRNARGILATLYRELVQPVAAYLGGRERVIVVPHGPTHAVPFHALHNGTRYLVEAVEVSVCPSSTLLRLCAARPRRGTDHALVIAHSDGGRLPHVLSEAKTVSSLLSGECYVEERATRKVLMAAASRCGVIHLAAHGEGRLDNPTFAHLKLADGQLSTVDVFNLQLNGALVTLSACETGKSVVTGGDELIGLSRGFLYAGASTLIQSLWRVDDGSTACLMERFYGALRRGRTKGAALREAQRALLAGASPSAFFWAPFQLVGDSGPLS